MGLPGGDLAWQGPVPGAEKESDDDKDRARGWAALRDPCVQRWVVGTVGPWGLQEDRLPVGQVAMGTHGPRDGELPSLEVCKLKPLDHLSLRLKSPGVSEVYELPASPAFL